jgi:high-affinity nickel-transport protein
LGHRLKSSITSSPANKFGERFSSLRGRIGAISIVLIVANLGAWAWALLVFRHQPLFLGTALLAYGFGLRHAVDADHIAAIDNVTRKLMHQGERPVGVGFWFAVGHSAVVFLTAAAIAVTASTMRGRFEALRSVGAVVSTGVSVLFLFAIAAINLLILRSVWISLRDVRAGKAYSDEDFDLLLNGRGLLSRLFRPLFRLITKSWHMLPLGLLFGLGFDTATEIALLGISATEGTKGLSIWSIMIFPTLFAAGMSLIDTIDGVLMLTAYDWAFVRPIRKLYYNLMITSVSVFVAIVIGGIEVLGLLDGEFGMSGKFWRDIKALLNNFSGLGFAIIAMFIFVWVGSVVIYRYMDLDA